MRRLTRFLGRSRSSESASVGSEGPPSVVLFDFDGTIADTFSDGLEILNSLAGEFNFKKLEGADVELARDMTTRQVMRFLGVPSRKLPGISHQGIKRLKDRMERIGPFDGVVEMLAALGSRNIRLGIVTSNSEENVRIFLRRHGITEFEFVRSSSRLLGKARVIRKAMKEFGFSAVDSLFVGDETRDIEACRRAGMRCVAVTWGYNSRRALELQCPHRIIDSPADLAAIIDESSGD